MKAPFIEIDGEDITISPFDTVPIEGYEIPEHPDTKEKFPACCDFHSAVIKDSKEWFNDFPNDNDHFKYLRNKLWFKKNDYNGVPEKVLKQLSFTEYHISERIHVEDWFHDITDYIDYNVSSFGQPAIGVHLYLHFLSHYIKNTRVEIPIRKRESLIEFVEKNYRGSNSNTRTNLNVLFQTYDKWLKLFPFEISFFAHLKPHFQKLLPLLKDKPIVNRYTGIAKAKMHTKSSLILALENLTNDLITQINTLTLYQKGLLNEPQKIKLELVLHERKMKLQEGYSNNSKDEEQRYRKALKAWFQDEKKFIEEIIPFVKELPPQPILTKAEILNEHFMRYGFFELQKMKLLSDANKIKIVEKLAEQSLPYAIAMFDYLEFIQYLEKNHFSTKYKLHREVSKWFNSDSEGRAVKGNINSLIKGTTENLNRYTAHKHKETVIKYYENLK
jgi:hypothetical protein